MGDYANSKNPSAETTVVEKVSSMPILISGGKVTDRVQAVNNGKSTFKDKLI